MKGLVFKNKKHTKKFYCKRFKEYVCKGCKSKMKCLTRDINNIIEVKSKQGKEFVCFRIDED